MTRQQLSKQDQFAELLSEGLDMVAIRQRMNLTNAAAQGLMTRIRRKLGPQAV